VTSTSVVPGEGGRQVLLTGAVEIALSARTRVQPYAIAGAGVARNTGEAPVATLNGSYQFLVFGVAPVHETDSIAIRASVPRSTPVGVFGGGARVHLSPRWGIRGDVRVHVGRNRIDTLLDETPFTQTVTAPMAVIASGTTPSIQFRNFSTPGAGQGNGQNTFSGDPISGFKTFTGTRRRDVSESDGRCVLALVTSRPPRAKSLTPRRARRARGYFLGRSRALHHVGHVEHVGLLWKIKRLRAARSSPQILRAPSALRGVRLLICYEYPRQRAARFSPGSYAPHVPYVVEVF
jgi:hypothetical protein